MDETPDRAVLWQVSRAVERIAGFPSCLRHKCGPQVHATDVHVLSYFARSVCVLLGSFIGSIQLCVSLALDSVFQAALLHGWWSYQYHASLLSLNRRMGDDLDQVLLVLIQRHMLSILRLWEASIVRSEENSLVIR
jgi:hypothetical protein